jgi:hypothetical protein
VEISRHEPAFPPAVYDLKTGASWSGIIGDTDEIDVGTVLYGTLEFLWTTAFEESIKVIPVLHLYGDQTMQRAFEALSLDGLPDEEVRQVPISSGV